MAFTVINHFMESCEFSHKFLFFFKLSRISSGKIDYRKEILGASNLKAPTHADDI